MIEFREIGTDKRQCMELLLLADEQEDMIDRYLDRGDLFALFDPSFGPAPVCVSVVTEEGPDTCELKNIAVLPELQRKGYGRRMLDFLFTHYRHRYRIMLVGTGDTPSSLGFYQSCGFIPSHRVPHFFTQHYDHPMVEDGVLLDDMVYLKKEL